MTISGWNPFDHGKSLGLTGTENGIILCDEEHPDGSRITLERGGNQPFAITCGIYGWMVHTRFFSAENQAWIAFQAMKTDLVGILDLIPPRSDMDEAKMNTIVKEISSFVERNP
jgi:hypothetical protein